MHPPLGPFVSIFGLWSARICSEDVILFSRALHWSSSVGNCTSFRAANRRTMIQYRGTGGQISRAAVREVAVETLSSMAALPARRPAPKLEGQPSVRVLEDGLERSCARGARPLLLPPLLRLGLQTLRRVALQSQHQTQTQTQT